MKRDSGLGFAVFRRFIERLLERTLDAFGRGNILSFALFGSIVRGKAKPESDIDILLVHKEVDFAPVALFVKVFLGLKNSEEYQALRNQGIYPSPSPIFMTPKMLSENPLILLDIMTEGILLYDKDSTLEKMFTSLREKLERLGAKKLTLKDGSWVWDLKPDWKMGEEIEIVL